MARFTVEGGGNYAEQSGVKKYPGSEAEGLLLRGVVVETYEVDNAEHPFSPSKSGQRLTETTPTSVYCDVMVYSNNTRPGLRWFKLTGVLVAQPFGGLFDGRLWKPRAAKIDLLTGDGANKDGGTRPENMDGDHVLVQFIDGNPNQPVITASLPHPQAQSTTQLVGADGNPLLFRHNGVRFGVTGEGDFEVDTTESTTGDYVGGPAEPSDGVGNLALNLKDGAVVVININGSTLTLQGANDQAELTLGDGAVGVVLGPALKTYLDAHVHPTALGPSGPPTVLLPATAISTKVTIPDG